MNFLRDIITYVRRLIKSPSNTSISDALIIDYINRFWIMDVDAEIQLFDLKTKYQFQTAPGIDRYNMPLYSIQSETPGDPNSSDIGMYPVYQGFLGPAFVNGIQVPFDTQENNFFNIWPNIVQQQTVVGVGNAMAGPYTLSFPIVAQNPIPINPPVQYILRGHVDINGIIATGNNVDPPTGTTLDKSIPSTSILSAVYFTSTAADGSNIIVQDSGTFLTSSQNYGLLMSPGPAPYGYSTLAGGYSTISNTINYFTGIATGVTFPAPIPLGVNINAQCFFFQCGLPRAILFYNNTLTFRSPPDKQYLVELEAYLSPAAFFNTAQAIPFAYMSEYISLGAARKIMSDTGDLEQLQTYEPRFREQRALVWKRSQRQWTSTRTQTIYSQGINQGQSGFNNIGGSTI